MEQKFHHGIYFVHREKKGEFHGSGNTVPAMREALGPRTVSKRPDRTGLRVLPAKSIPEFVELARLMHADIEKWKRVTRDAGTEPQ
jgi:hypothetical protein